MTTYLKHQNWKHLEDCQKVLQLKKKKKNQIICKFQYVLYIWVGLTMGYKSRKIKLKSMLDVL